MRVAKVMAPRTIRLDDIAHAFARAEARAPDVIKAVIVM